MSWLPWLATDASWEGWVSYFALQRASILILLIFYQLSLTRSYACFILISSSLFPHSANNPNFQQRCYKSTMKFSSSYDYIFCGAGSAGCVLANRLSAHPDNKVLLLEAGPKDWTWKIHMPAALMYNLWDNKYNWYYETAPQEFMNNR